MHSQHVNGVPIRQTHGSMGRWCSLKARSVLNYLTDIERERMEDGVRIQGKLRLYAGSLLATYNR